MQHVNTTCSALQYMISKGSQVQENEVQFHLFAEGPCGSLGYLLTVLAEFLQCPDGFSRSQAGVCQCEERLRKYTSTCIINNRSITRTNDFWVGYDRSSQGLVLHPHCPFDYCKPQSISFTLNSTYLQCAHGRSGTICGACKPGLSLNLGSSHCSKCSIVTLLLVPLFALAGFVLVVFLFMCKMTVAAGTTSGFIFYGNVVWVNRNIFFPTGQINVLTVFIAWLNLDLGIRTCLFDGMDAYVRTWLQFLFPFYIWSIAGLITMANHYSTTIARIVSVLAMLFLLSYTKLLRTIIATFAFTTLDYPDDSSVVVWVYNGNIRYMEGKHIALFIAGLLASLTLFLPYTLILLFGQCIMARSNYRLLSWIDNLKVRSFLDAYHAPYKNSHRYWVGLMMLIRFILFTVSATIDINSPRDPSINLLVLVVVCSGLWILVWNTGNVYKQWYTNVLESASLLNLTILAVASYQVKVEGGSIEAVGYTSVSVAFVTFLGVITYHVTEWLTDTRTWRSSIKPALANLRSPPKNQGDESAIEMTTVPSAPRQPVTTTFVKLREPLQLLEHKQC